MQYTKLNETRILAIHISDHHKTLREETEDKEEFVGLVGALGWDLVLEQTVRLREYNPATYIGSGKAEELRAIVESNEIEVCAFDAEINPSQQRNLEEVLGVAVVDRSGIIIEIFSDRAQTNEAKVQVEMARLGYILPRLTSSYTALSRQRGGAKGNRGKGETQLELDRRKILKKIDGYRAELKEILSRREVTRRVRNRTETKTVALVGYTNAGKSLLHASLTKDVAKDKNMLFATLDPSVRSLKLRTGLEVLCVDTVGFIRRLPHDLIEAFKATLEETRLADVIVHVVDGNSQYFLEHFEATNDVLRQISAHEVPSILAINKIDLVTEQTWKFWKDQQESPPVEISARTGQGLDELLQRIEEVLYRDYKEGTITISVSDGKILSYLYSVGAIVSTSHHEETMELRLRYTDEIRARLVSNGFAILD